MIGVVTGGRDHWPSLAELEHVADVARVRGVTLMRDGDCPTGVDRMVRGYLRSRGVCEVEKHPADWDRHGRGAGMIRNVGMLDGDGLDGLFGASDNPPASILFALTGGPGTANCRGAAVNRGIEIIDVPPVAEPRPWNRHHGNAPGSATYVGRGHILGNPFALPDHIAPMNRASEAARILASYGVWLWARLNPASIHHDPDFGQALDDLDPRGFVVCSCWPLHCHAEVIVRAWRHRQRNRS